MDTDGNQGVRLLPLRTCLIRQDYRVDALSSSVLESGSSKVRPIRDRDNGISRTPS